MNKVKGYRVMIGLTQEELASIMGISRECLMRKENTDSFNECEKIAITAIFNQRGLSLKQEDIFLN